MLCAAIGIVVVGFALIGVLFQQQKTTDLDNARSMIEIQERIQETIEHLRSNPKDGSALKLLGAFYKEAVSAYVSASRELPGDREIQRAFIDLRARGHASSN